MANRVTVSIRNHIYPILAEEDESYIRQCADLVIRELDRAMEGTTLSLDDGAVLACLNLADQYYKERQVSDNLRAQLKEALDENARIRRQTTQKKSGRAGRPPKAAQTEPEGKPKAEPKAENVPENKPKAESAPQARSQPEAKPEPAPQAKAQPRPKAEPASQAKPQLEPGHQPRPERAKARPVFEDPGPDQTRLPIPEEFSR